MIRDEMRRTEEHKAQELNGELTNLWESEFLYDAYIWASCQVKTESPYNQWCGPKLVGNSLGSKIQITRLNLGLYP